MAGGDLRILSSAQHGPHVLAGLRDMRQRQLFCDARLQAKDGNPLDVHKILLMSCSHFFHSHFTSNRENADVLKLPEASCENLSALLDFVYTGDLVLSEESVDSVQDLANQLHLADATDLCEQFSRGKSEKFPADVTSVKKHSKSDPKYSDVQSDDVDKGEPNVIEFSGILLHKNSEWNKSPELVSSQRTTAGACTISSSVSQNLCNSLEQNADAGVSGAKRRKPGRPQKLDSSPDHQTTDEVENVHSSGRTRRKCIKPKKLEDFSLASGKLEKSINTCNDSKVSVSVPVKRGRGRPRKVSAVKLDQVDDKSGEVSVLKTGPTNPKRKRGRPIGSKGKKKQATTGAIDNVKLQETNLTEKENSETATDDVQCTEKSKTIQKYKCKHKCRRCREEFDSVDLLEKHRIQCRKVVNFDQPDKYKRKRCAKCQIEFPDFESYQEHRKTHKKERNLTWKKKPHVCDICDQSFRYESFLACHRYSKHKIPFDESKHKVLTCPVPVSSEIPVILSEFDQTSLKAYLRLQFKSVAN